MEDQAQDPNSPRHGLERTEPVRSRWTPKPEQILILESIFNNGMVNPHKDDTVRIRKLLEKYGSVGDANVFYWFQNRRSRSRRRQRQLQASLSTGGATQSESSIDNSSAALGFAPHPSFVPSPYSCSCVAGSSSSSCGVGGGEYIYSDPSDQIGLLEMNQTPGDTSVFGSSDDGSNLHHQLGVYINDSTGGVITVYINGVPTEVPRGPFDMKAVFGQDLVLVDSSGVPVPFDEYGFLIQSLQHCESYFLVSRLA